MRTVAICLAYYLNPQMLKCQYEALAALPRDLKKHLQVIIVDDGSPLNPASPPASGLGIPLQIFRITVDVRWNQDACRNLAVDRAPSSWLLLTDMDHLIPEATLRRITEGDLNAATVYQFKRVSLPNMTAYTPHVNSWCLTKEMYDRIGGYDERLAGLYGTDADFRHRVGTMASIELLDEVLIRVTRDIVPDASTTNYSRNQTEDGLAIARIKAKRALEPRWKPLRLTFPWIKVFDSSAALTHDVE